MTGFPDPFSIATTYEVFKIVKREKWLQAGIDIFRPKHRFILLGSTGVGKSQFLQSIPEFAANPIAHGARTTFNHTKRLEIKSKLFEFTDTPGEVGHLDIRRDAIKTSIKRNVNGIINFVCFGYHEYGIPKRDVFYRDDVRKSYLDNHKKIEIDLLSEWMHLVSAEWILTIVTKADIWWDDKESVIDFYEKGPYFKAIEGTAPRAHHVVRPYSSISSRFYGQLSSAATFDDQVRTRLRSEVFRVLRESVEKR